VKLAVATLGSAVDFEIGDGPLVEAAGFVSSRAAAALIPLAAQREGSKFTDCANA